MTTLLDLDNRSGWVEGIGPVSAHHTRLLRPTAALQALWVDCDTGVPLGIDPKRTSPVGEPDWADPAQVRGTAERVRENLRAMLQPVSVTDQVEAGRFPSTSLGRLVKIRDLRCTGIGCPQPASRCEIDHLTPVSEGGQTALWQLALKSPRCHHARHDGWHSERHDTDGSTSWHSPAGGQYQRRSPWRPPPPVHGPLPPPRLDRPDGGRPRTFDTDAENPPPPEVLPTQIDPSRTSYFDLARECRQANNDQPRPDTTPWDRPWHTDDPPPF
jgi:hypothetical protein